MVATAELGTRAVLRRIEAGELALCAGCEAQVKFRAKVRTQRVVANVYDGARWDRVEIWHPFCYEQAGEPYGRAA